MNIEYKISTRRYGRLLAILYIRDDKRLDLQKNDLMIESIKLYLPSYDMLTEHTKNKILSFAHILLEKYKENQDLCIDQINKASFNRRYELFNPIDKALLCIGLSELTFNKAPLIVIKEILIISDLLKNEHAAPYISGILKNISFGILPYREMRKKPKIRLKLTEID